MSKEPTEPEPPPPSTTPPVADEGTGKKGWSPTVFYVGAGLTAVLGGVTVWSGIDTVNNPGKDKVQAACSPVKKPECDSLYDEGRSNQTRTNILIGATAAVGVATILVGVLAVDWSGGKSEAAKSAQLSRPRVALAPWASFDGGGLQAVGRF